MLKIDYLRSNIEFHSFKWEIKENVCRKIIEATRGAGVVRKHVTVSARGCGFDSYSME